MSQDREATQGAQQAAMTKQQSPPLSPAFLNHLVAHVDPHRHPPPNATLRSAQIACSRWVALRRLRVGLSRQQLANMTGLTAETIMLIETGVADVALIPPEARQLLVTKLAVNREEQGLASEALAIALGQIEALSVITMDRVIDDLGVTTGEHEHKEALKAEVADAPDPVPAVPARPIGTYVALLKAEPTMFDALRVLGEGVNHAAAILESIQALPDRSRSKQAAHRTHFASMLDRMIEEGLIIKIGRKPLPGAPGRSTQHFQITDEGRYALRVVERHRAIEAVQKTASTGENNPVPGTSTGPLLST